MSEPKSNEPTAPLSRVKTASGFAGAAVAPTPRSLAHLGAGTVVSRYRVESVLGEGGMGVVYIARQEKPDREVALKVVRPGYATPSMLRRFEYESEVLGRLLHPGIAQIYEAGTADAGFGPQPFFAMELVKGVSLTRHASEKKLSTRERLELLAKVCDAVQHAHQKGVIHRDLKPGNILVGVDGQPKILDFGVARATGSDIQQTTMQTDVGAIVGTIPYMSPEQVGGDPNELDTRSDVYALGVIAYELLVGRLPYDLERKMIHEAARIIREDEPTRLSSINRTLRGDVETIVGHALEKDKARRYSTASALAADIRRYLSDEPIAARPSSTWYQVQKFSRRNRALVGGIVVSFLILLMGLGGTAWQARIARAQRDRADDRALAASAAEAEQRRLAEAEAAQRKVADEQRNAADEARRRAESINEFVTKSLQASDPNQGGAQAMTVTQAMSQALADLDRGDLNEQPATVAALLRTISQILNGNGRSAEAEAPAERALDLEHRLHSGDHAEVATSLTQVAQVRHSLGRSTEAELLFAEALEMRQRLFKGDHLDVAASLNNLALVRLSLGHAAEAEPLLEEALEMTRRLLKGDHREVADALNSLAGVRRELGRVAEAERLQLEELEMLRRLYGGDHPLVARDLGNLAGIRDMLGHSAEAEVLYVQALEMRQRLFKGDHPDVAVSLNNLAFIRGSLGRLAEAEPLLVQALEMQQRLYEGDHPEVAVSLNNVAYVRQALGRAADAEPLYVQSLEMRQRLFKGDHVDVAQGLHNLGYVLSSLGRASEAEPLFVQALEMLRRLFKGDHPYIAKSMNSLAYTRASLERAAEAEPLHVEALEMYQRLYGDEHPDVAETMMTLARCLATLDRLPESLARAQAAADMAARILPEGHPTRKKCDDTLAYIKKKIEAADPTTPAPPTPPPATSPPPDGG